MRTSTFAALLLVLPAAACAGPVAPARPPASAGQAATAEAPPGYRRHTPEEIAADAGITVEQARARQVMQDRVAALAARVAAEEAETFAGWYGIGDERVAMRFTRDGEATLRRHTSDPALLAAVEVQSARWSLRELEAARDEVVRRIRALGLQPVGQVDLTANVAVVYINDLAEQRRVTEAGVPIPENVRLLRLAFEERPA
jgi:hypothetical protein